MATIVIHGTMTIASAKHARWWWDSWQEGGFLHAARDGMQSIAGTDDLWTVGGRSVREMGELQMKWSLWTGYLGQLPTHQGHFTWSGADDYTNRAAGAGFLAKYLSRLAELAPRERLTIIAHSHGCNVVKMASSDAGLSPAVHIDRAVFLACPHFACDGRGAGRSGGYYPYQLDPRRFGDILNLSSETDSIQVGMADAVPGRAGTRWTDYLPPTAHRTDPDPQAAPLYENWSIPTSDAGRVAHTVMHGATIGSLVGLYLGGQASFGEILDQGGNDMLPVPPGDVGE